MAARSAQFKRPSTLRMRVTPILTVMLGSALPGLLPMIATFPILPPVGLLLFVAWRRLRSDLWPAWIGLPLGLWDDLFSGQPLGSAILLWTCVVLAFELIETRVMQHDQWIDWILGSLAIAFVIYGNLVLLAIIGVVVDPQIVLPQLGLSIFLFPLVARFAARLDSWRIGR